MVLLQEGNSSCTGVGMSGSRSINDFYAIGAQGVTHGY